MKLTDLHPKWILRDGKRIGFMFRCPLEPENERRWQTCFFQPTPSDVQWEAVRRAMRNRRWIVQLCNETCGWKLPGSVTPETASFETMTVTPSIDGSAGGNWHGFITNGEIVGGLK